MSNTMYDIALEQRPPVTVNISRVDGADTAIALPRYETDGAAGMDIRANLSEADRDGGMNLAPQARALVPTGLKIAVPPGYEMQVRPRSGLALKAGITVLNAPGTIDSDYRGEVGVILFNTSDTPFRIGHGDRIAQFVLAPVSQCAWHEVEEVASSDRGSGGFGSTGV